MIKQIQKEQNEVEIEESMRNESATKKGKDENRESRLKHVIVN